VTLFLALLLAVQQPQVVATVDRSEVELGDDVVLIVRADAPGSAPTEIEEPELIGFEVRDVNLASTFSATGGAGTRIVTWEYRLRATSRGPGRIGPIRVRVGDVEVEAPMITVDVRAVDARTGAVFTSRIRQIVARAPGPDGSDEVMVTVVPSADTIVLGAQLDLVVVAWFPRDVRARLRTRPTLTPPELQGAWTYFQSSALDAVSSREVWGRLYDLFVHRQVVFPLTAGPLEVGPATVSFSLPLRTSILSREIPQEVQSESRWVEVAAQPEVGRPGGFTGVAAGGLSFEVLVDSQALALGGGVTIRSTVQGRGNIALWPEPQFRWPRGVRVYPGGTDLQLVPENDLIAGTKTFTYLVVPDSAGTFAIRNPVYPYFDLDTRRYREARAGSVEFVARGGRLSVALRVPPPLLMEAGGEPMLRGLMARIPLWGWLLLVASPAGLALIGRLVSRVSVRRTERAAPTPAGTLERLDRQFRGALERLVPDAAVREGHALAEALRAAGVETPVAAHASRLRDRLGQAVYGPDGASDPEELGAEVQEVLNALPGARVRNGPVRDVAAAVAVVFLLGAASAAAQEPTAEQLFEARLFGAAADSFALRGVAQPGEAAHWFNLGSALFALGEEDRARLTWVRAARISPRRREIRDALSLTGPPDANSSGLLWIAPVAAWEAGAVAVVAWLIAWLLMALGTRYTRVILLLTLSTTTAAYAAYVSRRYRTPVAVAIAPETPLRSAPYGSATAAVFLDEGMAVRVNDTAGVWLLVTRGTSQGWVLREEVERL
jgi:hypothetical protein